MKKVILSTLMLCTLGLTMGAAQVKAAPRYLVLADSIHTQVYGGMQPNKMAFNHVASNTNAIFDVLGSPGLTVAPQGNYSGAVDLLPAIEIWKGRYGAYGVFIQVSTNDHGLGVHLEDYKANLRTLVGGIRDMGLAAACLKPVWKSTQNVPNQHGYTLAHYQNAMVEVCNEFGVGTLTFTATSADFTDGIHFNEAGHRRFANWFIDVGVFLGGWQRVSAPATLTAVKRR